MALAITEIAAEATVMAFAIMETAAEASAVRNRR
jgi:hypothetical protein